MAEKLCELGAFAWSGYSHFVASIFTPRLFLAPETELLRAVGYRYWTKNGTN